MATAELSPTVQALQERIEAVLDHWLPPENAHPAWLHQAMHYSVMGGGKRVRPILVYAAGRALGLEDSVVDGPAAAVELVHVYSLIHDDLPEWTMTTCAGENRPAIRRSMKPRRFSPAMP